MSDNLVANSEGVKADSLDIIRSETALSRYPVHNLSTGNISIEIKKKDDKGAINLLWKVSYNSEYGQPVERAYKLDTLVVNRRIDRLQQGGRPVPKMIKLGSLTEICDELGITSCGKNKNDIKRALLQNASAFITMKGIRYEAVDNTERTLDAGFTRYSVIFTGERLPDGLKADAVFLVLNDIYMEVLNAAKKRPLDYDYLRDLAAAPQRFYEILSYQMLPAVRWKQRARLTYSDFCLYSTLTRYPDYDHMKKQMWKIHKPHLKADYISKVEYEPTVDDEGKPDWDMFYTPGERARFQQLVFSFALEMPLNRGDRPKRLPERKKENTKRPATTENNKQLPLPAEIPQANTEALALVKRFYRLRYGQEKPPTGKELDQAVALLAEGAEWAGYLVECAARYGKEQQNGFPENFGGVGTLAPKFKGDYETNRKEREAEALKKARKSHEDAHRGAYHAFLGELLGGKLEEAIPEAYSAFKADEERVYAHTRRRASRPDAGELSKQDEREFYNLENRVRRFLSFMKENPRYGIPTFWQWDEKLNSNPFQKRG